MGNIKGKNINQGGICNGLVCIFFSRHPDRVTNDLVLHVLVY